MSREDAAAPPRRRRGRPRLSQEGVDQRRAEIIQAAYDVFIQNGYHASGVADIAARLGLGHGTFYRYFESKRDILDYVIDHAVDNVLAMLPMGEVNKASSNEELRAALHHVGDVLFAEGVDFDPRVPRLLLMEAGAIDEQLLQRLLGLIETGIQMLMPILEKGTRDGFLPSGRDPEATARAGVGFVIGAFLAEAGAPVGAETRRRYTETVVSLICDGA